MITSQELLSLLQDLESSRVERKESLSDKDKIAQAVTAFCNDLPDHKLPGYLVLGARDNGEFAGLKVTEQTLQTLAALRSDGNIQPLPAIRVEKFSFPEGDLAVVEVLPSDLPPVRYKGQVWIRVGPRRGIASEQEERLLAEKRTSHARTFDALPCQQSSLQDLSVDLFQTNYLPHAVAPEVIAENHRDVTAQLVSLRFHDLARGCPTNAGILLFGKNPLEWLPGAYVQFLTVDGTALSDPVSERPAISGDLLTVLRELDSLAHLQIEQKLISDSLLQERTVSNYPPVAIRELLMNAVMHRSYESTAPIRFYRYSDRIEIQSPGGLYGEASPENFPSQTSYRNPVLAEAMKTLGFVNRFGRGVIVARAAMEKNGSRPPEFHFDPGFVRVILWAR